MGGLQSGGGTSAVAASAHAGCERFRLTDPFLTGKTRKALATHVGHPDSSAGIPEARWMRAMTFESLVHSERFVSELLTKTIGQLDLPRPKAVRRRDCHGSVATTANALARRHLKANFSGEATMLTALGVPYLNLEDVAGATAVQPDFAIVCPRELDGNGRRVVADHGRRQGLRAGPRPASTTAGCSRAFCRWRWAPSPPPHGASCPTACRCTAPALWPCRATPSCSPRPSSSCSTTTEPRCAPGRGAAGGEGRAR